MKAFNFMAASAKKLLPSFHLDQGRFKDFAKMEETSTYYFTKYEEDEHDDLANKFTVSLLSS